MAKRPRLIPNAARIPGQPLPTTDRGVVDVPFIPDVYERNFLGNYRLIVRNPQGQEVYSAESLNDITPFNDPPVPAIEAWNCILEEEFWITEILFHWANIPQGCYIEAAPDHWYDDMEAVEPRRIFNEQGNLLFTVGVEAI